MFLVWRMQIKHPDIVDACIHDYNGYIIIPWFKLNKLPLLKYLQSQNNFGKFSKLFTESKYRHKQTLNSLSRKAYNLT